MKVEDLPATVGMELERRKYFVRMIRVKHRSRGKQFCEFDREGIQFHVGTSLDCWD